MRATRILLAVALYVGLIGAEYNDVIDPSKRAITTKRVVSGKRRRAEIVAPKSLDEDKKRFKHE